ncbi:MAG: S8 family serine peptidase [bacterium]|nr:S8 family serine peptidase [bacterium]
MRAVSSSVRLAACFVALAVSAVAAEPGPGRSAHVLQAQRNTDRTVPLAKWDPASPQQLVRVDGALYQEDRGLLYPVLEGRISVRLAEGVDSWDALLARAALEMPTLHRYLATLRPLRANKLGIVDLAVPAAPDVAAWCETVFATGLVSYAEVATLGTYGAVPNDPMYSDQYALNNTGQTGGTPGADIDAEAAWDLTAGHSSIVVAVLDSGTDIDHEDLAATTWHNAGETPDNGQDDDGNGFVDDWEGWDFGNDNNDPRGLFYHGTHVTGIVNAVIDNGTGIAGIAGGFGGGGVRAMALAVGGGSPNSDVIDDAVIYAADNGAHIITLSLGVAEIQAISDALDYAYNTRGVFIDCASGNSSGAVAFPARQPEVMAVGATDHDDLRASYSNFGPEIEIVAPGSDVLSTQPGDGYGESDGTSFAAPQVAGVAALILSRNPGLPAPFVRQLIQDTADDIADPGWDPDTGHGRLNAYAAVAAAESSDGQLTLDAVAYACGNGIQVSLFDSDLADAGTVVLSIDSDTEPGGDTATLSEVAANSGVFRSVVATATGSPAADGVLQVSHGDSLAVEYVDADDGEGGSNVLKTAVAQADCFAPLISNVSTQAVEDDSASVTWTTDEPANSVVHYGETVPPDEQEALGSLVQAHSITLGELTSCTPYRFEVLSTDSVGQTAVDDASGAYHEIVTLVDSPGVGLVPCTIGQVELDRSQDYGCDETADVTVIDLDLDTDPAVVENVSVLLTSTSDIVGEWITLTEISARNTRFAGSIQLDDGAATAGDGKLTVSAGDLITATYHDADDGTGQARIATAISSTDCAGPQISDVRVTNILDNRATVEWATDEPATSRVEFGSTPALGDLEEDTTLRTSHSLNISPFDSCERVHFRVSGEDARGDGNSGAILAFNLNELGGVVFRDGFETDTGWTLAGSWERATPQGLGSNGGDPDFAFSGDFVLGNDLTGQGAIPGNYESTANESAFSPEFSTLGRHNLELVVQRRVGLQQIDQGRIRVHRGGTSSVAQTLTGPLYEFEQWTESRIDISAWADDRAAVQLEFYLRNITPTTSFGWNIDEVVVKDATAPDLAACGGCGAGPGFAGLESVHDPAPCGPGGLELSWQAAAAWGTGNDGTYDVYRGTSAGFVPGVSNRVATGLSATTWTDAGAPTDVEVWYVVRARNDESCSGGEGLDDGNTVRLPAVETTAQSAPAPVGSTLTGGHVGHAHVRLQWAAVTGAEQYVIRRGTQYDFSDATEIGTTSDTLFEDLDAAPAAESYVYKVFSVNACGQEE